LTEQGLSGVIVQGLGDRLAIATGTGAAEDYCDLEPVHESLSVCDVSLVD
jgi:hypothetical protein